MRAHSAERPYICPVPACGYSTARRSFLKAHTLTHSRS